MPPSSHGRPSGSFGAADVHEHQESGDEQSHPPRDHFDRHEEPDEGGHGQESGRQVNVEEERGGAALQDEGEPSS